MKVARGRSWQPEIGMEHASRAGVLEIRAWEPAGARFRTFSARHCSSDQGQPRGKRNDDVVFFFGGCSDVGGGFFHRLGSGQTRMPPQSDGTRRLFHTLRSVHTLRTVGGPAIRGALILRFGGFFHTLFSGRLFPVRLVRRAIRPFGTHRIPCLPDCGAVRRTDGFPRQIPASARRNFRQIRHFRIVPLHNTKFYPLFHSPLKIAAFPNFPRPEFAL